MIIIGELINATREKVRTAVAARDAAVIRDLARRQEEAGATYIDVNVAGISGDLSDEVENMKWAVSEIMEEVNIPLSIDSTNLQAMEAGLRLCSKGAFMNSVSAEKTRMEPFLELAATYNCFIVALPIKDGIPATAEERLDICAEILKKAEGMGIVPEKLFFDPLIVPIGVNDAAGAIALEVLKGIRRMSEAKTTVGLSNISFGLPRRDLLNIAFLITAMHIGLNSAILNPLQKEIMGAIIASRAVVGKDPMCLGYIKSCRRFFSNK